MNGVSVEVWHIILKQKFKVQQAVTSEDCCLSLTLPAHVGNQIMCCMKVSTLTRRTYQHRNALRSDCQKKVLLLNKVDSTTK